MYRSPRLRVLGLAALTVALVVMAANAQPPGRGPGGAAGRRGPAGFMGGPGGFMGGPGGGLAGLLARPQVQEELKLSDAQNEDLRAFGEKLREEMRGSFPDRESLQNLSEEERRTRFQEAMEKARQEAEKRAPEVEKKIAEILTQEQFQRLKQIQRQLQGVDALVEPDVIQALGITEDQQKKIKGILEKRDKDQEALREQGQRRFEGFREMSEEEREKARASMQEAMEKGREIRSEAQKAAMGVLTDDQRAKLPEVMGEPFQLRGPEGGPPGGGPGARRPGGQAGEGQRGEGRRARRPGGNR